MHTKPPEKPDFGPIWAAFVKLAVQNMHLGCVTALLMYRDPCVSVTKPYISPCAYSTFFQDAGANTARTPAPRLSNRDVIMGPAPWGTGFAQVFNDLLNEVGLSAPFPPQSSMHSTLPEGPSPPVHSLLLPNGCRLICTDLDHKARSLPPIHPRRPQNTASRSRPTASHTASCSHLASQRPHPSVNMMWSTRLKMENAPALGRLTASARYEGRS